MKRTKEIKWSILLLVILALIVGGCGNSAGNQDKPNISPTVTQEITPTITPEATPTPTEVPKNPNPFALNGYLQNEDGKTFDEANNVQLLAMLEADSKIGENLIFDLSVLSYGDTYILVEYVEAKTQEDYYMAENCKHHLVLLSSKTLEIVKEVVLDGCFYINTNKACIYYEAFEDSKWTIYTYDYELNPIAQLKPSTETLPHVTADGKRGYYVSDKKIYVLNGENQVEREVLSKANYLANYVSGVVTDENGNDFVIFYAMAADYKDYTFILDVSSGEVLRVFKNTKGYFDVTKNTYVESYITYFYPDRWLLGVSKEKAYDFSWTGVEAELSPYTLNNGDKLFKYVKDGKMYLFLYDFSTATLKASTSFALADMEQGPVSDEYMDGDGGGQQVFISDNPVYMDENTILLQMSNFGAQRFWIKWNLALDEDDSKHMVVKEHEMGTLSSVDISNLNNPLYTPGKLSDELKPLRAKADQLEEKYGVEIYIGEECANILGGYSVAPLTEYRKVEASLEMLDQEMQKYPDNFFGQFKYSWIEGLDIYLASTLKGIDEDVLNYAGGFKTVYNSNIVLVLDCNDFGVESIFHHELCHAIEEKIKDASYSQENPMFHDDIWNSFNPYADMYTYTYAQYGFSKYQKYAYENNLYSGDIKGTYFVDGYAMTYPSEDRARLFESIMSDELYQIDFSKTPNLMKKLNYYAKCIRSVFDTTGWENVPWEAYLK